MIELVNKMPEWLRTAIVGALTFGAGVVSTQYFAHRSTYIEALTANYEEFNAASAKLEKTLERFARIADGREAKAAQDPEDMRDNLLAMLRATQDLNRRIGGDERLLQTFETASVELQKASESVTGPADGKALVLAVEQYLIAEQAVRSTVVEEQNSFLW